MLKSSPTTQLVSQIVLSGGRTISYEYDAEERITKVDDSVDCITTYTYDALGQLISETAHGITTKFEYDNYGNIVAKGVVDETGEIVEETKHTYVYGDGDWKDLLTSYNGQSVAYDAQGNPTNYLGHTLTWEKGRQLKSFDSHAYTYNANGIRTSKTVNGITHIYTLDGANILRETWGPNALVPMYDNEENICGIIYNDNPFYFQKNLQGDIIAIVDKSGKVVAEYSYDAWGVCTIQSDTSDCNIATINPYRYRGYYYDAEIGMYYLQSRYYDPVVGRFVNGDDVMFLGTRGVTSYDLFAYCGNNSVTNADVSGYVSINLTGVKLTAFIRWIKKIANFWSDGYERRLINVTNGAFTLYLSMSVATTLGKLKVVNISSNSLTISGRGFSTKLGYGKISYTLSRNIGGLTIEMAAFVGSKGYGMGLSFIHPIYNLKNKKVGYWAINLVGEVTYMALAAVAVTVAGACVVMPVVTPMAKQLVSSFYTLSSPSRIASLACTFYSLATKLASRF